MNKKFFKTMSYIPKDMTLDDVMENITLSGTILDDREDSENTEKRQIVIEISVREL